MVESKSNRKVEDCVICMEPNVQPCTLPCKHVFCAKCSKGILKLGNCPLCRVEFDKLFVPAIDHALIEEMKESDAENFARE